MSKEHTLGHEAMEWCSWDSVAVIMSCGHLVYRLISLPDPDTSAMFNHAVVCDMANGGQVLLEAVTFNAVRDRLTELGQVDHNGYNDSLHGTACAHARDSRRSW